MDETIYILINQVIVMFILMLVGMYLFKKKHINEDGSNQISYIVLYVSTPLIILNSLLVPYDAIMIDNGVITLGLSLLVVVLSCVIAFILYRNDKTLNQFGIIFSNTGFLGIPLIRNVLGEEYVFYISIFIVVQNIFSWTYGVYLVTKDTRNISISKIITNPTIIAVIVGLVLFFNQIHLPIVLTDSFGHFANLNTGLAMMVLGIYLAQTDLVKILHNKDVRMICLFRLILIPLMSLFVLSFFDIALSIKIVIMIGACTPCAGLLAMFCQQFGSDYKFGAGVVGISTVLSLVTMPIFVQLLIMMDVM